MFRFLIVTVMALSVATGLAACGDTWRGVKKDTGDNLQATGKALEKTGGNVKD